jgi:hypothetical protein
MVVQMRNATYYSSATRPRETVGTALYGDRVTVTALDGSYAKVTRADGTSAYIHKSALIPPDKFEPHPENAEETARLNAQNYKSGRFDKDTEQQYIQDKGPAMKQAYAEVDKLMVTPAYKANPTARDQKLKTFREGGRLGEFSSVPK